MARGCKTLGHLLSFGKEPSWISIRGRGELESNESNGGTMAAASPGNRDNRPNPNEKLVRVFDTEQESEAMVVRGLLESAGIDCDVTALDAPQDILPGVGGTVILVREEDADEARRVIEEYRKSPDELETAEFNVIEDPPEKE